MVFKLVRTDTVEPCKIHLPVGIHSFGRGKFFDCSDSMVSRNHGVIEVTDDTVRIRALHKNPCFYTKKGTNETLILRQNDAVDLANGDRFGLLPDSYWYELLYCTLSDVGKQTSHNLSVQQENDARTDDTESIKTDLDNFNRSDNVEETFAMDDTSHNEDSPNSPSLLVNQEATQNILTTEEQQENSIEACQSNDLPTSTIHDAIEQSVTKEQQQENSTEDYQIDDLLTSAASDTTEKGVTVEKQQENSTEDNDLPTSAESVSNEQSFPLKRSHSSENSDDLVKKVKIEPGTIKQEPAVNPGPSNKQDTDSNSTDKNLPSNQPSALLRERCMYGANCYRKNPQHKAQFCHPSDADWGPGERGDCPWGAGCRRRDPRHWRDHTHPPGTQRPGVLPPRPQYIPGDKKKKKRSKSPEVSTDVIVTGKRARKTVNRPSWSGSESENEFNDPFLTDDSDEWEPPSDYTQSDYTQDTQDF